MRWTDLWLIPYVIARGSIDTHAHKYCRVIGLINLGPFPDNKPSKPWVPSIWMQETCSEQPWGAIKDAKAGSQSGELLSAPEHANLTQRKTNEQCTMHNKEPTVINLSCIWYTAQPWMYNANIYSRDLHIGRHSSSSPDRQLWSADDEHGVGGIQQWPLANTE